MLIQVYFKRVLYVIMFINWVNDSKQVFSKNFFNDLNNNI